MKNYTSRVFKNVSQDKNNQFKWNQLQNEMHLLQPKPLHVDSRRGELITTVN